MARYKVYINGIYVASYYDRTYAKDRMLKELLWEKQFSDSIVVADIKVGKHIVENIVY